MGAFLRAFLLVFLAFLAEVEAQILGQNGCQIKKQYTIDMGSTTTKVAIANVQICANSRRVVGAIERRDFNYDFNFRAKNKSIMTEDDRTQLEILLKEATIGLDPSQFYGCIATGGARKFTNGSEVLGRITPPCRVIDPSTEGRLGYHSLLGNDYPGCGTREKVMWDIGGASSQIYSESGDTEHVRNVPFGSDKIREVLAASTEPAKKCVSERHLFTKEKTPNPIGDVNVALARVRQEINLSPDTGARLKNSCLVGIGKAHSLAIHDQMRYVFNNMKTWHTPACLAIRGDTFKEKSYTVNQVRCMADFLSKYNDCELEGIYSMIPGALRAPGPDPKFSLTNVSTLIFALGVLDGNFPPDREIHIENVSLAEPLLTYRLDQLPGLAPARPATRTTTSEGRH